MSLEQRLGQMFMVGTTSTRVDSATAQAISTYHIGNVILMGRSDLGTSATAKVSAALQSRATTAATAGARLLIAADHEGGFVQPLRGPGFYRLPTALTMGTWTTPSVVRAGQVAGQNLRSAGINTNLAPVLDTVPSAAYARTNPPIGVYEREFGYDSSRTTTQGNAFRAGSVGAGVVTAVKHFPGLGLVHANTDTTADVHDTVTTVDHPYLRPFRTATQQGTAMVMMSSAIYDRIDATRPAVFSSKVVGILRGWGYQGVVMTDDIGNAKALAAWTPGTRAFNFVRTGGDLVLDVNPSDGIAAYRALLSAVRGSTVLQARVNTSALRVLRVKEGLGLLGPPC
jgi:beta-N-acetylhexosaminidase